MIFLKQIKNGNDKKKRRKNYKEKLILISTWRTEECMKNSNDKMFDGL